MRGLPNRIILVPEKGDELSDRVMVTEHTERARGARDDPGLVLVEVGTHNLCVTRIGYLPALAVDEELVKFLAEKATCHQLSNPKDTPVRIRENIETGILRHVLQHPEKIYSD